MCCGRLGASNERGGGGSALLMSVPRLLNETARGIQTLEKHWEMPPPSGPGARLEAKATCSPAMTRGPSGSPADVRTDLYLDTARVGTSFEFFGVFFLNFLWPVAKKLATR